MVLDRRRDPDAERRKGRFAAIAAAAVIATLALGACSGDAMTLPTSERPSESTDASDTVRSTDTTDAVSTPPETDAPTTSTSTTTTLPPTTTTTLPPFVTEGATVLVANAASVPGAATTLTQQLAAAGFTMQDPTDAAGTAETIDITRVYAKPGAETVAASIATALGLSAERMPTPPLIQGALEGLGEATVLVMLGKDFAGAQIPALAPR